VRVSYHAGYHLLKLGSAGLGGGQRDPSSGLALAALTTSAYFPGREYFANV
jgi:hypothetical protein